MDQAVLEQIATVINNVSATYNMGLSVSITPEPIGQMVVAGISNQLYMWSIGWTAGYPWATQMLEPFFLPTEAVAAAAQWNYTQLANLVSEADAATASDNMTALIQSANLVNELANQKGLYFWTFYPEFITPITSNIKGYYFNPGWGAGFDFAALY